MYHDMWPRILIYYRSFNSKFIYQDLLKTVQNVVCCLYLLQDHQGYVHSLALYLHVDTSISIAIFNSTRHSKTHGVTDMLPRGCYRRYPFVEALWEREGLRLPRHPAAQPWPCGAYYISPTSALPEVPASGVLLVAGRRRSYPNRGGSFNQQFRTR